MLNADDPLVAAMADAHRGQGPDLRRAPRTPTSGSTDVRLDERGPARVRRWSAGGEPADASRCSWSASTRRATPPRPPPPRVAVGIAARRRVPRRCREVAASSRWRMEVSERADGVTVVNDAYNANPDSMAAALRALVAIGAARRRAPHGRRARRDARAGRVAAARSTRRWADWPCGSA